MAKINKVLVGVDDQIIELTGVQLEAFETDREAINVANSLVEAKEAERKEARESAIKKLAEIAGLTKEELASIL
jgi:hypothetical protein